MNDLKKTFLAGFFVLFILLLTPYYLQLIGYQDVVVDEGKICPKGKAWAMRKYGKWSAYAAMGASKYCKDPNYGKGKKKK